MKVKKICSTFLAFLMACSFTCPGAFASRISFDDIEIAALKENDVKAYSGSGSIFYREENVPYAMPGRKKIIINYGVETIKKGYFSGRSDIDEVVIPTTVKNIESYAFANCVNLTKIVIEGDVSIGEYSFAGCKNLIEISMEAETKGEEDGIINNVSKTSFSECNNLRVIKPGEYECYSSDAINIIRNSKSYIDEFGFSVNNIMLM